MCLRIVLTPDEQDFAMLVNDQFMNRLKLISNMDT